jgi:hypothetical protein
MHKVLSKQEIVFQKGFHFDVYFVMLTSCCEG